MMYKYMCNHCQSHSAKMVGTTDARKGFLTMIADASSQISEMETGIIAKSNGDKVEIGAFGSIEEVISISGNMYLANLKVALDKAKADKDIELVAKLYDQLANTAIQISGFIDELGTTSDEIKASLKEG